MTHKLASVRALGLAALVLAALHSAALAKTPNTEPSGDTPFSSMVVARDEADDCRVPKPPADLAETAYLRNGYRAILRILAARHWQETGDCACVIQDIPWDEVVAQGAEFVTGDDPLRPFDTSELRLMADALEAERAAACES